MHKNVLFLTEKRQKSPSVGGSAPIPPCLRWREAALSSVPNGLRWLGADLTDLAKTSLIENSWLRHCTVVRYIHGYILFRQLVKFCRSKTVDFVAHLSHKANSRNGGIKKSWTLISSKCDAVPIEFKIKQ